MPLSCIVSFSESNTITLSPFLTVPSVSVGICRELSQCPVVLIWQNFYGVISSCISASRKHMFRTHMFSCNCYSVAKQNLCWWLTLILESPRHFWALPVCLSRSSSWSLYSLTESKCKNNSYRHVNQNWKWCMFLSVTNKYDIFLQVQKLSHFLITI